MGGQVCGVRKKLRIGVYSIALADRKSKGKAFSQAKTLKAQISAFGASQNCCPAHGPISG